MAGETRERLIAATGDLLRERGYHGTGISDIVARSGAPSGSLYHFFPGGKEELAVAAIESSGAEIAGELRDLIEAGCNTRQGLAELGSRLRRDLLESGYLRGCPVATVALEVAAEIDVIQAACAEAYAAWQGQAAELLRRDGLGDPERALDTAAFLIGSLEGALLLSRAHRDAGYLDRALLQMDAHLDRLLILH